MSVVVVTGAAGALGTRVVALAAADPEVTNVVAIDREAVPSELGSLPGVDVRRVDLRDLDLRATFCGATSVLHLARSGPLAASEPVSATAGGRGAPAVHGLADAALAARVLDAAAAAGARHVLLLSDATAYGAWANNPVPLTEDAALRPNPGALRAIACAEIERSAAQWRETHPGMAVTLVRPAPVVGDRWRSRLAAALRRGVVPVGESEPVGQFLDIDDLASAVDLARRSSLDGPRNVAPDGWADAPTIRALSEAPLRFRLPGSIAVGVRRAGFRRGVSATPPELLAYLAHPWVIGNDRLRSEGWEPRRTNEEALAAAVRPGPLEILTPRRRQELALGIAAAAVAATVAALGAGVRHRLRA